MLTLSEVLLALEKALGRNLSLGVFQLRTQVKLGNIKTLLFCMVEAGLKKEDVLLKVNKCLGHPLEVGDKFML